MIKFITLICALLLLNCQTTQQKLDNKASVDKQPLSTEEHDTSVLEKISQHTPEQSTSNSVEVEQPQTPFTPQQNFQIKYTVPELDFTCSETLKKVSDINIIPPLIAHDDQLVIDGEVTYKVLYKEQGVITHLQVKCHKFETRTRRGGKTQVVDSIPAGSTFIFGRTPPIMIDENDRPLGRRQQRLLRNLTMPQLLFTASEEKRQQFTQESFSTGKSVDLEVAKLFLAETPTTVTFEGTEENAIAPHAVFSFTAPRKTGEVYTQNGLPVKINILEKDQFPQGQLKVKITTKTDVKINYE